MITWQVEQMHSTAPLGLIWVAPLALVGVHSSLEAKQQWHLRATLHPPGAQVSSLFSHCLSCHSLVVACAVFPCVLACIVFPCILACVVVPCGVACIVVPWLLLVLLSLALFSLGAIS